MVVYNENKMAIIKENIPIPFFYYGLPGIFRVRTLFWVASARIPCMWSILTPSLMSLFMLDKYRNFCVRVLSFLYHCG